MSQSNLAPYANDIDEKEDHKDHVYIVTRMEKYREAYTSGKWANLLEFYDPTNCLYQDFHTDTPSVGYEGLRERYERLFGCFADYSIETSSIHGNKGFTAWEWEATGKLLLDLDTGGMLAKEDAPLRKMVGATLMWWEGDKITKSHDYMHQKPV
ncbi:hypothetical protein BKA63DRAFT_173345 [Paraphoma chrysanthemicola]|nr:hypothetical protein BKA63DRAFT_173345 [Paraphoma chrysanthemicola]